LSDVITMNGKQFIRQARRWANANGQPVTVDSSRGKGGHKMIWIGSRFTTVKTSEIGAGLLASMLKDLGIKKEEF
jgi:hypothetical protein